MQKFLVFTFCLPQGGYNLPLLEELMKKSLNDSREWLVSFMFLVHPHIYPVLWWSSSALLDMLRDTGPFPENLKSLKMGNSKEQKKLSQAT